MRRKKTPNEDWQNASKLDSVRFSGYLNDITLARVIAPKPHGGGQSAKLSAPQLEQVKAIIEGNNDATLVELCELVAEQLQVPVSRSTMGRITQKIRI